MDNKTKATEKTTIALLGHASLRKMLNKGSFSQYKVTGIIDNINPVCVSSDFFVTGEKGKEYCNQDEMKRITSFFEDRGAEYLIVDLECVKRPFAVLDNYCISPSRELANRKGYKLIEPASIGTTINSHPKEEEIIMEGVRNFAKVVKRFYKPEQIIVLSCLSPKCQIVGPNVTDNPWFVKYNPFLERVEEVFLDVCGGKKWDVLARFFPLKKDTGKQLHSTDVLPEFYEEAKEMLNVHISKNGDINQPTLRYFVNLYSKYETDTLSRRILINSLDFTSNTVLGLLGKTSTKLFLEYFEYLEECYKENFSVLEIIDKTRRGRKYKLLKESLACLSSVEFKIYDSLAVNYDLMFDYNFSVLEEVVKDCHKYIKQRFRTAPKLVTRNNVRVYFAWMQASLRKKNKAYDTKTFKQLLATPQEAGINMLPLNVDILGSCLSRFIFNTNEKDFAVNKYAWQINPLYCMQEKKETLQIEEGLSWSKDFVIMQLKGKKGLESFFKESSKWVVIDNYFVSTAHMWLKEGDYIQSPEYDFCKNELKLKNVPYPFLDIPFTELEPKLDLYAEWLNGKYGNNIIIVNLDYKRYFIQNDGSIGDFGFWYTNTKGYSKDDFIARLNNLQAKVDKYLAEKTGAYVIDFTNQFFPDECSFGNLYNSHKEKVFFWEASKAIRGIIQKQPNKKRFTTYDGSSKLFRLKRLHKKNFGSEVLREVFSTDYLDEIMLKLTVDQLEKHEALLLELSRKNYKNIGEACAHHNIPVEFL